MGSTQVAMIRTAHCLVLYSIRRFSYTVKLFIVGAVRCAGRQDHQAVVTELTPQVCTGAGVRAAQRLEATGGG